ncbi:hypothetical protein B0F90DRAFT_1723524 [Multifurca ochricompacta]|uniref:Uncharacterized protein n=1 Tax=Multifurca ochricompacta TaxID=376703 RepID=A0AAD4QNC4_9AGAM|nr:hypothetical protein B0F90DRAFT_1723524 [Multifurca ochricompacta]
MARKGGAANTDSAEPRRSSRIKDQAKPEPPPKKTPVKPRSRKAKPSEEQDDSGHKEKPKSVSRGKKRTADEKAAEDTSPAVNGEDAPPPAKKAKPDSQAASKPASKVAAKPSSKIAMKPASKVAATEISVKPTSKVVVTDAVGKPSPKVQSQTGSAKPASKGGAKPASRAGSRKPASKV